MLHLLAIFGQGPLLILFGSHRKTLFVAAGSLGLDPLFVIADLDADGIGDVV